MQSIIHLDGRFGNWLWNLSAGLTKSDNIRVSSKDLSIIEKLIINKYLDIQFTNLPSELSKGTHQSKQFIVDKDLILPYIKQIDTPHYDNVIHIRGEDYFLYQDSYAKCVRNKDIIDKQLQALDCDEKDIVVITNDTLLASKLLPNACIKQSNNPLYDWWSITNACNVIMAPSSFSWWAAYLGNHDKVIAPELWPMDFPGVSAHDDTSAKNHKDIMMDNWIII